MRFKTNGDNIYRPLRSSRSQLPQNVVTMPPLTFQSIAVD